MARRRALVTAVLAAVTVGALGGSRRGRRTLVRRPRRQLLLGHRHPQLPRRRHQLPALGVRLPLAHRAGAGLRAELPGLLGGQDPRRQLDPALRAVDDTAYVTISVGGNDAGFADVLTDLRPAGLAQRLQRRHRQGPVLHQQHAARRPEHAVRDHPAGRPGEGHRRRLPAHLQRRGLQPAHLVLPTEEAGSTPPPTCSTPRRPRAPRGRVRLRQPDLRFVGHARVRSTEWINGLSNPVVESYHPNRSGHASGYTPTVSP